MDYSSLNQSQMQLSVECNPISLGQLQSLIAVLAADGLVSKVVLGAKRSSEEGGSALNGPISDVAGVRCMLDIRDFPFAGIDDEQLDFEAEPDESLPQYRHSS